MESVLHRAVELNPNNEMYMYRQLPKALPLFLCLFTFNTAYPSVNYSTSPRQTGEVVLDETVLGPAAFVVRVGSNGCTSKRSFEVSVRKSPGVTERAPHYVLTILRKVPDECKAIVDDGEVIAYDLKKDLGISGSYTYSLSNPVASSHPFARSEGSFISGAIKDAVFPLPEMKEVRPEPFEKFSLPQGQFTCLLPTAWKRADEPAGPDDKSGIHEVRLVRQGLATPEDGEKFYFPEPLLYAGYYAARNETGKTYESFVADYDRLRLKNAGSVKSTYRKPEKRVIAGREATVIDYEVWQETPRGPLFTNRYWLHARFIVVKGKTGFYVLALKSPRDFYEQCLPAFTSVVDSFVPDR